MAVIAGRETEGALVLGASFDVTSKAASHLAYTHAEPAQLAEALLAMDKSGTRLAAWAHWSGAMRVPNAATLAPIRPVANGKQQKIVAATVPAEVMVPTSLHFASFIAYAPARGFRQPGIPRRWIGPGLDQHIRWYARSVRPACVQLAPPRLQVGCRKSPFQSSEL
jgi:hypothetical protein